MRYREQGFTLIEIMVVITIIVLLAGAVALSVPLVQERAQRSTSTNNLKQLYTLYTAEKMERQTARPRWDGGTLWLSYRKKNLIKNGQEEVLMCPGDRSFLPIETPEDRAAYDEINLENPSSKAKNMVSYAARNFTAYPLKAESKTLQIIGGLRQGGDGRTQHFDGGTILVFEDGAVRWQSREDLGLAGDADIVIGEESDHDLLKKISGVLSSGDKE